ncbi:hypothetical protein A2U01_0055447 [Trifolium medium]|uniref:Uncharacterized protein n=1 Tax=Trifolium medium TaxID=97028 RepID=A0A392RDA7_9FABA|nr:hypothetical protein [Trifolium medium]
MGGGGGVGEDGCVGEGICEIGVMGEGTISGLLVGIEMVGEGV